MRMIKLNFRKSPQRIAMKTLLISSFVLFSLTALADSSDLCGQLFKNSIQFANQIQPRPDVDQNYLTLITWNAHKYADSKYFWDLNKLAETSDILMVQEAMHSTGWQLAFANAFQFSFSFYKSFCTSENLATGVQTAARYLLTQNENITSMDTEPVTFTPKVTGLSRIEIPGHGSVLLVNTHALNFNSGILFERQIDQVVARIAAETGPIIWAGDFNSWTPMRKSYLNAKTKALGMTHVAPKNDNRNLILDHIYVRGFTVESAEVLTESSSDHLPLKAVLKFIK